MIASCALRQGQASPVARRPCGQPWPRRSRCFSRHPSGGKPL